jgi:hypothetical protein
MSSSHTVLKFIRLIHLYLGVFIAPALLFFGFTGAIQTFSLHETTRGSSYKPPAWAVMLAQIHKKQTPIVPVRKPAPTEKPADKNVDTNAPEMKSAAEKPHPPDSGSPSSPSPAPKPFDETAPKPHNTLPLKLFFLLVSIGLFVSTFSGLYMCYKFVRNRNLITATLLAGIIIPILLTIL